MLYIILAALLPVVLLLAFILRKDKEKPEPPRLLLKAFALGVLSVILTFVLVGIFEALGLKAGEEPTAWNAILDAFWEAAIPEEIAKFAMLWLVVRKNPHFDEKVDGIVYAVCVALGFAATENLLYLFNNAANFVGVGIARAIFAVPGHFCDGVFMGYFYSLACFGVAAHKCRNYILALIVPILAHGIYDSILFVVPVSSPVVILLLALAFLVFCFLLWKYAARSIARHLAADRLQALPPMPQE